jgi:hypothetical protein
MQHVTYTFVIQVIHITPCAGSVAHRYGYLEVLRVLLEGGANPLLLDAAGHSPLEVAQLPKTAFSEREGSAPQAAVVALLKQHVEK